MKQALNFDANQANILQMWEVKSSRRRHLGRLNTIYRDKSMTMKNRSIRDSPITTCSFTSKTKKKDL